MALPCNENALAWVDRFPDWPYTALIIYGEKGCGKTHLLNVWRAKAGRYHLIIDNADDMFGDRDKEIELFHRFNQSKEDQNYLAISITSLQNLDKILLPDLKSRLKAAPMVKILPPDDMDVQAILVKLFHDRQLKIEPGVIAYILPRIERSYSVIHDLVQKIDENSLSEKRSVTVPLVRDILQEPQLI